MLNASRIALAGILAVAITSCSRVFFVEPLGSLESGVSFEFRNSPDGSRSKHRIREFAVYQESGGSVDSPVWALEGSSKVHTVSYGESPKGLPQAAPASPLEAGAVYYVMARDKPIFNSIPGYASTYFAVNRSGEVHACPREKCAQVASVAAARTTPNKALQRTSNSSVQLTLVAAWRHTSSAGSDPVSAVAGR